MRQYKYSRSQVWDYVMYHLNVSTETYCVILITCSEDWFLIETSVH